MIKGLGQRVRVPRGLSQDPLALIQPRGITTCKVVIWRQRHPGWLIWSCFCCFKTMALLSRWGWVFCGGLLVITVRMGLAG